MIVIMNILRQLFEFSRHPEWFIWERTNWWQWGLVMTLLALFSYGGMALRSPSLTTPTAPQSVPR